MSSIQSDLDEMNALDLEIKRLNNSIKEFRKQKKLVETRLINYLKEQDTKGLKYNDQAIVLETVNSRTKKKKSEKMDSVVDVLRKYGVQIQDHVVKDLIEAQKGKETTNEKLKIVKKNQNNK